jgi:WD40 repeat protein
MGPFRIVAGAAAILTALSACKAPPVVFRRDFSPSGIWVAQPRGAEVEIRHAPSGNLVRTLSGGHRALVIAARYTCDGTRVVSGDQKGTIVVWNPEDGFRIATLTGHEGGIEQLAVREAVPDLASASDDSTIRLWDVSGRRHVATLAGHRKAVTYVTFSADGRRLVSASRDKTVKIWDPESGTELATLAGHDKPVRTAEIDPSGAILATGSDNGTIMLWDIKAQLPRRTLEAIPGAIVMAVQFSGDGRWLLALQSVPNSLERRNIDALGLWNVQSGEHVVTDYQQESRFAPPDWPYKAIVEDIQRRSTHRSPQH